MSDTDAGDGAGGHPGQQQLTLRSLAGVEEDPLVVPAQQVAVVGPIPGRDLAGRPQHDQLSHLRSLWPLLLAALLLTGCAPQTRPDPDLKLWEAVVVATFPHDRAAYTQGLEYHDGVLYESSGGFGNSWAGTSELESGRPTLRVANPEDHFAEGLTVVGDQVWQITWKNQVAILRDRATLAPLREERYQGEGWGLCHDGGRLVMSHGTSELSFRDPGSFAETGRVKVTRDGRPVERLNELECVGSAVWANVWLTEEFVRIDLASGRVTDVVRVGAMPGLSASDRAEGSLNGIAALPGTDELLITGKNWPHLYRIRLERP